LLSVLADVYMRNELGKKKKKKKKKMKSDV